MPRIDRPRFVRAEGHLLFDEYGASYIDLFAGNGTAFLGHCEPSIVDAVTQQAEQVWTIGTLPTPILEEAMSLIESFFPATHRLAGLYSTGMEAAEFALRFARVSTGRPGAIGFERHMHGKSFATAHLAWENEGVSIPGFARLPSGSNVSEYQSLTQLDNLLETRTYGAVFVEPLTGSSGYLISKEFAHEMARLCRDSGTLLVVDEILTGFYRTGQAPFVYRELGIDPDIVLIGKAIGSGFPVSGVIVRRKASIEAKMLPGSTFAGNALAAAAVAASLKLMQSLFLPKLTAEIETTILEKLEPLRAIGIVPRGKGAMWVIEIPDKIDPESLVVSIYQRGVAIGWSGRILRFLPAATIPLPDLASACESVCDAILEAHKI